MTWRKCPDCDTRWNSEIVIIDKLKNLCPNCGHLGNPTNIVHALNDNYDYTKYDKLAPAHRKKISTKSNVKRKCRCK